MSDLWKKSVGGQPAIRPRPSPISSPTLADIDDYNSSDSSASSAASVATVRPSSREHLPPVSHWTNYFDQELHLKRDTEDQKAEYHVYLSLPTNLKKGPLFICHHGAGASGLSFAIFAQQVRQRLPEAGILSLEARGHGSVVKTADGKAIVDFSLEALTSDAVAIIKLTAEKLNWTSLPPTVLVGHSLGGAIVTTLATDHWKAFGSSLIGYSVLDVVEGSAIEALSHMKTYLSSRPSVFDNVDEAIQWHIRSRTIRDIRSAEASVPSLLVPVSSDSKKFVW